MDGEGSDNDSSLSLFQELSTRSFQLNTAQSFPFEVHDRLERSNADRYCQSDTDLKTAPYVSQGEYNPASLVPRHHSYHRLQLSYCKRRGGGLGTKQYNPAVASLRNFRVAE